MSIPDISKELLIPQSTIRYWLKKEGVLRSRTDSLILAGSQGKLSKRKGRKVTFTEEWKRNIRKSKLLFHEKRSNGYSKKSGGYVEHTRGIHKGRSEHRTIMERHIGRPLESHEVVHHIDENKWNNDISNLQLMTRSEHARLHALIENKNRKRNKNGQYL